MDTTKKRAEITAEGLVQGVGFRYFVLKRASELGLTGYTENLFNGNVLTVAEGETYLIEELFTMIKTGPSYAHVSKASIRWSEYKNEFENFGIKY